MAADLGLFTSETESFCLSILELMSHGVPSAAFAVGGIPEVVTTGRTGLLVPFGDTAALTRAVGSLLADPARRAQLGRAAQKRARQKFSARAIVPPQRSALPPHLRRRLLVGALLADARGRRQAAPLHWRLFAKRIEQSC